MATADLEARLKQLEEDESLSISRDEYRAVCDEEDKIIYLTIARRMARANGFEIKVEEEDLIFSPL